MLVIKMAASVLCQNSRKLIPTSTSIGFVRHYHDAYLPPNKDERLLPELQTVPTIYEPDVIVPVKHPKAWKDMRGPERIHNQLVYGQYGIIALGGGSLKAGNFDVIRATINRALDVDRMFAIWRVDPPWKAVSRKSLGKKMGGGKAKVHHYETPIKAGRIIIEVGGILHYDEIFPALNNLCKLLPVDAMPISAEKIQQLIKEKEYLDAINHNPFKYRDLVRKNFSNSHKHLSRYERAWGGEYF